MKKTIVLTICLFTAVAFGQFRQTGLSTSSVYDGILNTQSNSLFGFLDSDNFHMNNSFEMSFATSGGQSLAMNTFTNNMFYKFSNKLNVQLSTSFVMSPYSSLGSSFQNNIKGIYITNAQLNYKPWKNVDVMVSYRQLPPGSYYYSPYSYYGGGWSTGFFNNYGFPDSNNSNEKDK
jgi:hypothetical protein